MRCPLALPNLHPYHAAIPSIDPQVAAANIEKAYSAEGTPENDIIAKFLNVVTSRVPEIMDMLAYYFPVGIVDNAEKFHQEFPRVVDATLVELKMIQDRASKENGYKSRGLYDRVTNCIAGELFSIPGKRLDELLGKYSIYFWYDLRCFCSNWSLQSKHG